MAAEQCYCTCTKDKSSCNRFSPAIIEALGPDKKPLMPQAEVHNIRPLDNTKQTIHICKDQEAFDESFQRE